MITVDSTASSLEQYYNDLYTGQVDAHGADYMLVHDEIRRRLSESESYAEFGVRQGTTLALVMLAGVKFARGYDIDLNAHYNKVKHLFDDYASLRGIDLQAIQADTAKCAMPPVDVLYIDSFHNYHHIKKELAAHGNKVRKYIICHDTETPHWKLKPAISEFIQANPHWSIVEECKANVGYMTLART
jgi:hypothetical protein